MARTIKIILNKSTLRLKLILNITISRYELKNGIRNGCTSLIIFKSKDIMAADYVHKCPEAVTNMLFKYCVLHNRYYSATPLLRTRLGPTQECPD